MFRKFRPYWTWSAGPTLMSTKSTCLHLHIYWKSRVQSNIETNLLFCLWILILIGETMLAWHSICRNQGMFSQITTSSKFYANLVNDYECICNLQKCWRNRYSHPVDIFEYKISMKMKWNIILDGRTRANINQYTKLIKVILSHLVNEILLYFLIYWNNQNWLI